MKRNVLHIYRFFLIRSLLLAWVLFFVLPVSAAVQTDAGTEQILAGQKIFTWEKLSGNDVVEAGVTIPFDIIANPPADPGKGPAGAVAVVAFPSKVRETTFLNHFELNWEKDGHEPPVFMVPHFDFHFYGIPSEQVLQISNPDPSPPQSDLIPEGYIYPGAGQTVPQMGVHAVRPGDLEKPFTDVFIFGFYAGKMIFLEPMVTQAALLQQHPVSYAIPLPANVRQATRFPTRFRLEHDLKARACHLIFSDFVSRAPLKPTTASVSAIKN